MLASDSSPLFLPYPELLLKPLSNGRLVDMQEQIALFIPYHLCRDIISKNVAPVLVGVKPPTIVDGLPVQQFVGLFCVEAIRKTFMLHIEETLEILKHFTLYLFV